MGTPQTDPHQLLNLAADPAAASLRAELDAALTAKLRRCHDAFDPGYYLLGRLGVRLNENQDVDVEW